MFLIILQLNWNDAKVLPVEILSKKIRLNNLCFSTREITSKNCVETTWIFRSLKLHRKKYVERGDIHTQTAKPNVNSTLNYITTHPPLQTSNVATLKILMLSKNIQIFAIPLPSLIPYQHCLASQRLYQFFEAQNGKQPISIELLH